MKTKQGKNVKKYLGIVGGFFWNNRGVDAYELEDGMIFLQGMKLNRKIPNHWSIISKDYYEERFVADFDDVNIVCDACNFVDPNYGYFPEYKGIGF